jgi:hypothetical protein
MKKMLLIWTVCLVALVAWTVLAFAQTAKPATMKTVKLSNGQEVFDISGEWDAYVENLNAFSMYGAYQQVFKITLEGNSFTGIRLKDNPPQSPAKAGSPCMQGEVDKNGIKKLEIITGGGHRLPAVFKISENGNKIDIDGFDSELPTRSQLVRLTLIRK